MPVKAVKAMKPKKVTAMSLSRVFKVFRFEAHPRKKILTILGEVAVTSCDTVNKTVEFQHIEEFKKRIILDNLAEDTNTKNLVGKILKSCPYIDESLVEQLTAAVVELQNRNYDSLGVAPVSQKASDGSFLPRFPDMVDSYDALLEESAEQEPDSKVDINHLDSYVELLYEDLHSKVKGAKFISELTKTQANLIIVAAHGTGMNALMRTLREESHKAPHLSKLILNICLNFARVPDFHDLLYAHSILTVIGTIIMEELQRYEKGAVESCKDSLSRQDLPPETPKHHGKSKAIKEAKQKLALCESIVQQDELLRIAFTILYEMVNDLSLLYQICSKELITALVQSLERENVGLLEIVLMTLKNLSIFKEGVGMMSEANIIDHIANLLKSGSPIPKKLVNLCFHFVFNLTFDSHIRNLILEAGLLSVFSNCLKSTELESIAIKVLYNLSMDPKNRFKFTIVAANVLEKVLENKKTRISLELGALMANLCHNSKCAALICKDGNLGRLLMQALRAEDELLMKSVRNLSAYRLVNMEDIRMCEMKDLAEAITLSKSNEFVIECVGTMSHLDPNVADFYQIFKELPLIPFFKTVLTDGIDLLDRGEALKSPMLFDVVALIGTCIGHPKAAGLLIGEEVIEMLMNLLCALGEDNKIQEQVLFSLCRLVEHDFTRAYVIEKTDIPDALISMFSHQRAEVQEICISALVLLARYDESWDQKIKEVFFGMANKKWIQVIENIGNPDFISSPKHSLTLPKDDYGFDGNEMRSLAGTTDGEEESHEGIFDIVQKQFQEEMAAKAKMHGYHTDSESEAEQYNTEEDMSDMTDTELNTDDSVKYN